MKYFELEKNEEEICNDFEGGRLKSIKNTEKEKMAYRGYVSTMLKKGKNINIRLSENDLLKIKGKAMSDGIPYQTYLSSLVHKHLKT
jgi:predicted DNA binding CopG/RHH family protein